MDFSEIVSVSGMPGLFKMLAKREDGIIVEAFSDGSKKFVSARSHMFTPLENITIYSTESEDIELKEVFKAMKKQVKENPVVDAKSTNDDLKNYFKKIVPKHDEERVYVSDIKKVVKWYGILEENNLLVEKKKSKKPKKSEKKEKVEEKAASEEE